MIQYFPFHSSSILCPYTPTNQNPRREGVLGIGVSGISAETPPKVQSYPKSSWVFALPFSLSCPSLPSQRVKPLPCVSLTHTCTTNWKMVRPEVGNQCRHCYRQSAGSHMPWSKGQGLGQGSTSRMWEGLQAVCKVQSSRSDQ